MLQLFFKEVASSFVCDGDQIFVTPATWTLAVKSTTLCLASESLEQGSCLKSALKMFASPVHMLLNITLLVSLSTHGILHWVWRIL